MEQLGGDENAPAGPPDLVLLIRTEDIRALLRLQAPQMAAALPFMVFPEARNMLEDSIQHRFGFEGLLRLRAANRPDTQRGIPDHMVLLAAGAAHRLGSLRQFYRGSNREAEVNAYVHLVLFRGRWPEEGNPNLPAGAPPRGPT